MPRWVLVLFLLGWAFPVGAVPAFRGLGGLTTPGGSEGYAVSADGSTVVGVSVGGVTSGQAFVWNAVDGMRGIGDPPTAGKSSQPRDVSADGSVVVGWVSAGIYCPEETAFIWDEVNGMRNLNAAPCSFPRATQAWGISADGSVVVGSTETNRAFIWDALNGVRYLGPIPGGSSSEKAFGVSGDGKLVAGIAYPTQTEARAFVWDVLSGYQLLPRNQPGENYGGFAISADGSTVVGLTGISGEGYHAARWNYQGVYLLPPVPGYPFRAEARSVSSDGSVIVGTQAEKAFVWDAQHGTRFVKDVLTARGLNMTGWELSIAWDVSADGRIIVGTGTDPDGSLEAWIAALDGPISNCPHVGALARTSSTLKANQDNSCERWAGVFQAGDNLNSAILEKTALAGANLSATTLTNANLANADVAGAFLNGTNLAGASVAGLNLVGAYYDATTIFPSGQNFASKPWGLDGGISPWQARMIPLPEPSLGMLLGIGALGVAGLAGKGCTCNRHNDSICSWSDQ